MSKKADLQEKYVRQLYIGCNNETCRNYFCRIDMLKSTLIKIANILSNYGEIFICSSIDSESSTKLPKKRQKNIILDFYLFVIEKALHFQNNEIVNENEFCAFFKKKRFTEEEEILIEGILHTLLNKYLHNDYHMLSHIIIRLLSNILLKINLKNIIFTNLSIVFLNIDKLYRELALDSVEDSFFSDRKKMEQSCHGQYYDCLFEEKFTEKDLKTLIHRISEYLNKKEISTIRTSKKIEELLNIFHILFCINEKIRITSFKDFYLEKFCESFNFREEIKLCKTNDKTLIKYPFILPLCLKSEYIKSENSDQMKCKLQDAFFRALFIGETTPYFFITVNRNSMYNDMFKIFSKVDHDDILKEIKISFRGEEGVDSGGITKEFFQLISEYIVQDNYLFQIQNNILWFSEEKNTRKYEIIGKLIGVALYNDVVLNLPFPTFLFKIFLNRKVEFDDLIEIEPEIYHSLNKLRQYNEEEIKYLEQTFTITRKSGSVNLIPNGCNITVNMENKEKFIEKYAEYLTTIEMKKNIDGIKKGFFNVIKMSTVNFLQPCELEKIIVGSSTIDVHMLRKSAIYSGYNNEAEIIQYFWKIFENYSIEDKKKLLMFITGNERVPVGGSENSKLIIIRNGCDTERLPSSQTCFNTLLLPEYSSYEKLENKLGLAISMTKGFFLL